MDLISSLQKVADLTTQGLPDNPDSSALVYERPMVRKPIPGYMWTGQIGNAQALIRLPDKELWNGKLMIGGTAAVRTEYCLDYILSDIVVQHGYAYAACDKGTPGLALRDPGKSMAEWITNYEKLTTVTTELVENFYHESPKRVYISGISNGGYIARRMLEQYPQLFDGGVEWEGVLWHPDSRHLITTIPEYIDWYPIYSNLRGDRTAQERNRALTHLIDAGLHLLSEPHWDKYYQTYWALTLWLYGRNLDPDWEPFKVEWSSGLIGETSPLARYPWQERREQLSKHIQPLANTGSIGKPLLSVAGNWDCLIPFRHHAQAYADLVQKQGKGSLHRLYEIARGNHVEGLYKENKGEQQTVHPYYEAALYYLEDWVEQNIEPPDSGLYENIDSFAPGKDLFTAKR
jgi:pimeloyl-ACP methyl ester carboxylesterase